MPKKAYHHGSLRSELIKLATAELESKGESGISLRELAAQIGVARSAPYRHFQTRSDLLAAVARNGIEMIRQGFMDAFVSDAPPREQLKQACRSYLSFASNHPQLYQLMFTPDIARLLDIRGQEIETNSPLGIFSKLMARAFNIEHPNKLHDYTISAMAILHGYSALRLNPGINADGFVESSAETMISLVANVDFADLSIN